MIDINYNLLVFSPSNNPAVGLLVDYNDKYCLSNIIQITTYTSLSPSCSNALFTTRVHCVIRERHRFAWIQRVPTHALSSGNLKNRQCRNYIGA